MRTLMALGLSLIIRSASALTVPLGTFDQLKLDELLRRLPSVVRETNETPLSDPRPGVRIASGFPLVPGPFTMDCSSDFFNGSPWPSTAACTITIDKNHPEVEAANDEIRAVITDRAIAAALHEAISYGSPEKEFRSFGKDEAIDFNGKKTFVFHYYFRCSREKCLVRFSSKPAN